ncbi:Abi-alpha family protein [Mucilaginibacter celer]|uniref:DUF4393 domain-containing protein n=1 Tax=Mucilaginibacter celer TaxID=2305508 RepID=A0A494VPH5_9SPHI|nr:Abi-alpha family protein [Mucilaginibacter celer]AYL97357.1 DUF4393 domain-containing protein [Mucilaginibacter celer]
MSNNNSNGGGFDLFGLNALGRTGEKIADAGIEGVKTFLSLTCKPLLDELGFMLGDKFRSWRLNNVIKILEKAQGKLTWDTENEKLTIDTNVAFQIIENASIVSNDTLQDMWAGLFASSINRYEEDENIFFIDILKRLTSSQVKLISYLCENTKKSINIGNLDKAKEEGVVSLTYLKLQYAELCSVMASSSRLKVDSEFDTLVNFGLIERPNPGSFGPSILQQVKSSGALVRPTLIALRLYVKCRGSKCTPFEYFESDVIEYYQELVGNNFSASNSNLLSFIYERSKRGEFYKEEIELDNALILKNDDWNVLAIGVLNERLRDYLIYRFLGGINKTYDVRFKAGNSFASFNYKQGLKKYTISDIEE